MAGYRSVSKIFVQRCPVTSDDAETPVVVLDNGSGNIRAGIAGNDLPFTVFPNLVGYEMSSGDQGLKESTGCYVGARAQSRRHILNLRYPITHGIVTDWCSMEAVWHYTYNDILQFSQSPVPVLITEPIFNPKCNREQMSEIWFETFQVPALHIANPGKLAVYTSGRGSALSFQSGDGVCQVVPIFEGYTVPHSLQRFDFGGRDLTAYLASLLRQRGFTFSTPSEMEIVRDIKEKLCYTALDIEQEMISSSSSSSTEKSYELPDGGIVTVGNERFRVPECMFQPSIHSEDAGKQVPGVHEMILSCIQHCGIDIRQYMYNNIVVNGGNTAFPGFGERLKQEIKQLIPESMKVHILTAEVDNAVWIGGSILGSLSMFPNECRTKKEFEEYGPSCCRQFL